MRLSLAGFWMDCGLNGIVMSSPLFLALFFQVTTNCFQFVILAPFGFLQFADS